MASLSRDSHLSYDDGFISSLPHTTQVAGEEDPSDFMEMVCFKIDFMEMELQLQPLTVAAPLHTPASRSHTDQ